MAGRNQVSTPVAPSWTCSAGHWHPQVQLRGFRVELGEVEAAVAATPGVAMAVAVVLADPGGAQRLVAYYAPSSVQPCTVVASLRERLPAHMVPSMIVPLERMPRLPNEKVDRMVLPRAADLCLCHKSRQ